MHNSINILFSFIPCSLFASTKTAARPSILCAAGAVVLHTTQNTHIYIIIYTHTVYSVCTQQYAVYCVHSIIITCCTGSIIYCILYTVCSTVYTVQYTIHTGTAVYSTYTGVCILCCVYREGT